jgi:hypothetical protein
LERLLGREKVTFPTLTKSGCLYLNNGQNNVVTAAKVFTKWNRNKIEMTEKKVNLFTFG